MGLKISSKTDHNIDRIESLGRKFKIAFYFPSFSVISFCITFNNNVIIITVEGPLLCFHFAKIWDPAASAVVVHKFLLHNKANTSNGFYPIVKLGKI